jgi:uncharacterized protein (TIGR02300 family)
VANGTPTRGGAALDTGLPEIEYGEPTVTKPEWGTKRTCQSCGAHFYDLRKDPIVCPKCGATYDPEAILKSRRRAPEKAVPVKPVKEPELPDPEADVETEDAGEEADDVIEDTSELGEDDEDIPETIEPDEGEGER